jgi:hypothetical protein
MPHTTRVDPALGRYLLVHPDADLRRRVEVLRTQPFPPGSRALAADAEWHGLAAEFAEPRGFIYGSGHRGLLYTYEPVTETLVIRRAFIDGVVQPPT